MKIFTEEEEIKAFDWLMKRSKSDKDAEVILHLIFKLHPVTKFNYESDSFVDMSTIDIDGGDDPCLGG
jgi:hypothetical protein